MGSMLHFCTYFDINYVTYGLALHHSLKEHCGEFRLWVLCMDVSSYDVLSEMALPELCLIRLSDFENGDHALLKAKQNRSRIEYYFTCTPSLPLYVLKNFPEVDCITYLDADLFFYSTPKPIFQEIGNHSIAIIEHRFAPHYKSMEICGKYNVGWISFKRDVHGLACLKWWRDRCNEWCYKRLEDGKFADQKYLDDWPSRFKNVKVIQHKGANLASWNIENYKVRLQNKKVTIDEQELIFFHFHGIKRLTNNIYGIGYAQTKVNNLIRMYIYDKYLHKYFCADTELLSATQYMTYFKDSTVIKKHFPYKGAPTKIKGYFSALYRLLISGNYAKRY